MTIFLANISSVSNFIDKQHFVILSHFVKSIISFARNFAKVQPACSLHVRPTPHQECGLQASPYHFSYIPIASGGHMTVIVLL